MKTSLLVLITVLTGALSQFLYKVSTSQVGVVDLSAVKVLKLLANPWFIVALVLLFVQFTTWILIVSRIPANLAMVIAATIPLIVIFMSALLLRETIPLLRWVGFILVFCGLFVVSRTV
jgi:drug/metabolite transporter (DMT)-like permease